MSCYSQTILTKAAAGGSSRPLIFCHSHSLIKLTTAKKPALKNYSITHTPPNPLKKQKTYRNKVLYHIHMWQRVDFGNFAEVGVDPAGARKSVASIDVHGTGAADAWRGNRGAPTHCVSSLPGSSGSGGANTDTPCGGAHRLSLPCFLERRP